MHQKEVDVCGQWAYGSSRRGNPLLIQFQNLTKTFDKREKHDSKKYNYKYILQFTLLISQISHSSKK